MCNEYNSFDTFKALSGNINFYLKLSKFLTNMSPDMREEVPVRAT